MTVPSGVLKHKYQGDGSNDQFDYDFKITSKNYVLVQKQVGTSDPVDLTVDIDFSMTGIGNDSGGVITYPLVGTKLAAQEFLIIKPAYPYNQNLQLNPLSLPPEDVEDQFDIMCMQIKQIADELSRALQVSEAYDGDVDSFISLITSTSSALIATISGTSTSTLTVGTGSKTFTTQSGKSWVLGQRLRAASDDGTKIMEGQVTSYSSTTLILDIDYTSGSGSHSDWNISLTGARGAAGAGTGDLLAANNLSDLANAATAFANIKQLATSSVTGVARQATNAEALSGLLDNTIISPASLEYVMSNSSHIPTINWEKCGESIVSGSPADIRMIHGQDGVTFDGTYKFYMLIISDLYISGSTQTIDLQFADVGGGSPTFATSGYQYSCKGKRASGGSDSNLHGTAAGTIRMSSMINISESASGTVLFPFDPTGTTFRKMALFNLGYQEDSTNAFEYMTGGGVISSAAAVYGFRLVGSANFSGGRIALYGGK